jgi:hypothetical protein
MDVLLSKADAVAEESGKGSVYGTLVALGATEMRPKAEVLGADKGVFGNDEDGQEDKFRPVGIHNQVYVLKRNVVPNGKSVIPVKCVRTPSTEKVGKYVTAFNTATDVTTDLFQLGRSSSPANAIVVKGLQWHSKKKKDRRVTIGPVSRFACRIVVDRLAPYNARVYAGGLDDDGNFAISENAIHVDPIYSEESMVEEDSGRPKKTAKQPQLLQALDYLSAYGVRIWRPDSRIWMEVSIAGNTYTSRPSPTMPGQPLRIASAAAATRRGGPFTNELIDGSILDICGTYFLFQSPRSMALTPKPISPEEMIRSWNSSHSRLLCPVLYTSLSFAYTEPALRARHAFEKTKRDAAQQEHDDGGGMAHIPDPRCSPAFNSLLSLDVPNTDPATDTGPPKTMVFPACGHVHGYHRQLQNQPCPMCRQEGPYVPLAFSFVPSISGSQQDCRRPVLKPTARSSSSSSQSENEGIAVPTRTRLPPSPSSLVVFNPCGHAVTLETAQRWEAIRFMPDYLSFHPAAKLLEIPSQAPAQACPRSPSASLKLSSSSYQQHLYGGTHSICPFCSSVLDPRRPYSQLVMQSEAGSDCDDMACEEEDDDHKGAGLKGTEQGNDGDEEEGEEEEEEEEEGGHGFIARLRAAGHDLGTLAEHLPPSALAEPASQKQMGSSPRSQRG